MRRTLFFVLITVLLAKPVFGVAFALITSMGVTSLGNLDAQPRSEDMMSNRIVFAIGFAVLALLCWLEFGGFLLVFHYELVKIGCALLAMGLLSLALLLAAENHSLKAGLVPLSCCLLMLAFGFSVSHWPGSSRKHFYILAHEIQPGDSLESVKAELSAYESWTGYIPERNDYYVSFRFTPSLGTTDSVSVSYNPNTLRVVDVCYISD